MLTEQRKKPKISIILPVYNNESTLEGCLESVRAQTYSSKELIVIDGGSSDGTLDLIRSREEVIDYWQSESDSGIYEAWNKGLDHVTGDWVHFLGADDYFPDPDVLARVACALAVCDQEVRIVYGKAVRVSLQGRELEICGEPWEQVAAKFRHELSIPHQATFHRTSLFTAHGRFNESFLIAGDYDFLLRELKDRKALFIPDIVVKAVACGGVSANWDLSLASVKERARAQRLNDIFPYTPRWIVLILKAVVKKILDGTVGSSWTRYSVDLYRRLTGRPPIWTRMG